MAQKIGDRTKETSTTTGTGTLSLLGAVSTFQTFGNGVGNGNSTPYLIDDGAGNWELTWGTVTTGTPDTITRGTLIKSSTGSRVSFIAGTKTVACVSAAELILWIGQSDALAEATLASATTTDLGSVTSLSVAISGTTTITGFGTQPNTLRYIRFTGTSLVLTYNATSLITPNGGNIQTAPGDTCVAKSDASGNWTIISYQPVGGTKKSSFVNTSITNASYTSLANFALGAGKWRLSAQLTGSVAGTDTWFDMGIGTSSTSVAGINTGDGYGYAQHSTTTGVYGGSLTTDVTLTTPTTYYFISSSSTGSVAVSGSFLAQRII